MINMINRKKILIIDDSAFMRRILSDIINGDDRCIVVGVANNGKEGLEKIEELDPDVITLDIEMPIMNGLMMLEILMKNKFKPVILLSSLASEGADVTLKALDLGAVDFICKPQNIFTINKNEIKNDIINKVIIASEITRPIKSINTTPTISTNKIQILNSNILKDLTIKSNSSNSGVLKKIIAIGVSTGGPKALQEVIPFLPANIDAGVVIVQHMPAGFTKSLAERLNSMSDINVKEAENGDIIKPGWAYIAPGNFHTTIEKVIQNFCIKLSSEPPIGGHRPSVNVMMNSLSKTNTKNIIAVIMTGMGSDGCNGISNLKQNNNAIVIAQNEPSCVVYGMPKVVIDAGLSDKIVPLNEIAKEIIRIVDSC